MYKNHYFLGTNDLNNEPLCVMCPFGAPCPELLTSSFMQASFILVIFSLFKV